MKNKLSTKFIVDVAIMIMTTAITIVFRNGNYLWLLLLMLVNHGWLGDDYE